MYLFGERFKEEGIRQFRIRIDLSFLKSKRHLTRGIDQPHFGLTLKLISCSLVVVGTSRCCNSGAFRGLLVKFEKREQKTVEVKEQWEGRR